MTVETRFKTSFLRNLGVRSGVVVFVERRTIFVRHLHIGHRSRNFRVFLIHPCLHVSDTFLLLDEHRSLFSLCSLHVFNYHSSKFFLKARKSYVGVTLAEGAHNDNVSSDLFKLQPRNKRRSCCNTSVAGGCECCFCFCPSQSLEIIHASSQLAVLPSHPSPLSCGPYKMGETFKTL